MKQQSEKILIFALPFYHSDGPSEGRRGILKTFGNTTKKRNKLRLNFLLPRIGDLKAYCVQNFHKSDILGHEIVPAESAQSQNTNKKL